MSKIKLWGCFLETPNELSEKLVGLTFNERYIWVPTLFLCCTILLFLLKINPYVAYFLLTSFSVILTICYIAQFLSKLKKKSATRSDIIPPFLLVVCFGVIDFMLLRDIFPLYSKSTEINGFEASIMVIASGASILSLIQVVLLRRSIEFDQYSFPDFLKEITNVLESVNLRDHKKTAFYYLCSVHAPGICPKHPNVKSAALPRFQEFMRAFEKVMSSQCRKEIAMLHPCPQETTFTLSIPIEDQNGVMCYTPFMRYWSDWLRNAWGLDEENLKQFCQPSNYNPILATYHARWDKLVFDEFAVQKNENPTIPLCEVIQFIDTSFRKLFLENKTQVQPSQPIDDESFVGPTQPFKYHVKLHPILSTSEDEEDNAFINMFISENKAFIAFMSPKHDKTFQIEGIKINNKKMLKFLPKLFESVCLKFNGGKPIFLQQDG